MTTPSASTSRESPKSRMAPKSSKDSIQFIRLVKFLVLFLKLNNHDCTTPSRFGGLIKVLIRSVWNILEKQWVLQSDMQTLLILAITWSSCSRKRSGSTSPRIRTDFLLRYSSIGELIRMKGRPQYQQNLDYLPIEKK